ncbi:MAG: nickel pincer cofactor biosynthesis protein LarC [Verrucomicrobia bacterium]|nr:nickel pincer cofactor biosynthesis protein LarC [Verrucomicrobiota bacterium]
MRQLILNSPCTAWVKDKSLAVFRRIAEAEGKVHGQPPETVHFHEVGAVDSIVDIVGACLVLEQLGRPRVLASPVVEGSGWIDCAHGRLPIPAPATLEILSAARIPVAQSEEPHELVTPTGAAILAEFVERFGLLREFVPARIGYGLGMRETATRPNVLRIVQGESPFPSEAAERSSAQDPRDWESDVVAALQSNLDDVPAEILGRFMELAMAQGALDVFLAPVHMKKNRPGTLLTLLCDAAHADRFSELILRETTAFGVRRVMAERRKLPRETVMCRTPFGEVAVKLGRLNGQLLHASPEFESCRRVAEQAGVALKQVYDAALRAAPAS